MSVVSHYSMFSGTCIVYAERMPPVITTDPQEELFDVVNEQDEVIGSALRREVHRDGSLIHRSIAVLVFQNNRLYLQLRSTTKDTYPGHWTCSCSGHVDRSETYEQAAKREIEEELGLRIDGPLVFLRKDMIRYPHETEYISFFRYDTTAAIEPNLTEISEGRFVNLDEQFVDDELRYLPVTPCLEHICRCLLRRDE